MNNLLKLLYIPLFFILVFTKIQAQNTASIIGDILTSIEEGNIYRFGFKQWERFDTEKIIYTYSDIVYSKTPLRVFIRQKEGPNEGAKILYREGENNNEVYAKKGFFSANLSLHNLPFIRSKQHHTINNIGFGFVERIIHNALTRSKKQNDFSKVFQLLGEITFQGRPCYKLMILNDGFGYERYQIKKGESLYDIAQRKGINEYLIVEKNKSVDNFKDIEEGQNIFIPKGYAKKVILYVDKANYHPIYQEMYDDKGMFEKYEYENIQINPTLPSKEFQKNNPEYKF